MIVFPRDCRSFAKSQKMWTLGLALLSCQSPISSAMVSSRIEKSRATETPSFKSDSSRRGLLGSACMIIGSSVATQLVSGDPVSAAETIGKDPDCNESSCLGVWDGLLADCPHGKLSINSGAGCVSSQDDTPGCFAEPVRRHDSLFLLLFSPGLVCLTPLRLSVDFINLTCNQVGLF